MAAAYADRRRGNGSEIRCHNRGMSFVTVSSWRDMLGCLHCAPGAEDEGWLMATHVRDSVALGSAGLTTDEIETMYVGLVRTYHRTVLSYVYSLTSDIQLSEDLTQDTFLKAYLALPAIGAPDNPRAWLFRIATNVTIDYMRKRQRFGWVSLHHVAHLLRGRDESAALETGEPVQRALSALSPDEQAILMLFAHLGLKAQEVAEVLGISPAAARKRRQRAREAFTRAYRGETS
jgi:RNA polymerase sigma-70 factor (ECF subfamily)